MTNTLRYDPYGNITQGAPKQDRTFGYNAEQYTPQTGLQYLRARHYDPKTGTFTSQDTYLGTAANPISQNRYIYANNNPLKYIDPSGHAPQPGTPEWNQWIIEQTGIVPNPVVPGKTPGKTPSTGNKGGGNKGGGSGYDAAAAAAAAAAAPRAARVIITEQTAVEAGFRRARLS